VYEDSSNPTLEKELYSIDILHSRDVEELQRVSQYWQEGQAWDFLRHPMFAMLRA
jgi:hypothetical protein